jgi:hypothetical protein
MLMPHESTVAHDKSGYSTFGAVPGYCTTPTSTGAITPITPLAMTKDKRILTKRSDSQVPNLFANPPGIEHQTHELDDDEAVEAEEDQSSSSY